MSASLMVSFLRKGKNGNEILEILNSIVKDSNTNDETPVNTGTLEEIQF